MKSPADTRKNGRLGPQPRQFPVTAIGVPQCLRELCDDKGSADRPPISSRGTVRISRDRTALRTHPRSPAATCRAMC